MKKDLIFKCYKCGHNLYLTDGATLTGKQIAKKLNIDCPDCGEERYDLWIYIGLGNFEKDYGK